MSADDIVVVSAGAVTAVGLTLVETAASVRAGIMRFVEAPCPDQEPFVIAQPPEAGIPDLEPDLAASFTTREIRMLRLAKPAISECLGPIRALGERIVLVAGLPDYEMKFLRGPTAFLRQLAAECGAALESYFGAPGGRAGGLLAMRHGMDLLSSGQAGWVLAGAADSYFQLDVLGQLDGEGRLKSSRHMDGFIPGEGAGWLLLTRRAKAERAGLPVLAALSAVAAGMEEGHIYSQAPYLGDGLARTLDILFGNGLSEPVREVYSSMNGERYWSKEWGVAFLRHRAAFHPECRMHHPADSFGDTGAACGPLLVSLAITGIREGYRYAPCLVYSSSDHGERAAVLVSAA